MNKSAIDVLHAHDKQICIFSSNRHNHSCWQPTFIMLNKTGLNAKIHMYLFLFLERMTNLLQAVFQYWRKVDVNFENLSSQISQQYEVNEKVMTQWSSYCYLGGRYWLSHRRAIEWCFMKYTLYIVTIFIIKMAVFLLSLVTS